MSLIETLQIPNQVEKIDFRLFPNAGRDSLDGIVQDYGTVYVTSITRDGCSGCMEQKPLYQQLALRVAEAYPGKTKFSNIHIHYSENEVRQSEQAKTIFGHGSYPTYMVHVKSRFGPLELYRAAYPKMEELEKQVTDAFELASHYKGDYEKHH